VFSFDVDGNAGQVFRLYQAVFGRAPDRAGLGFWMTQMDNGTSLEDVAANFMQAGEFSRYYGVNPSSSLLLINLYQNILHRTPDPAGYAWWKELLDQGAVTQKMVLVAFSEGQENVAKLTGVMQAGMEYLPFG
jgi:serralysin